MAEPTPPAGPGVVAPFPAPPREHNPRIWIGLIVAFAVVLLCGGGGVVAFVGYTVYETNQVTDTAGRFLTAVQQQRYSDAYRMQCAPIRQSESEHEFAAGLTSGPRLTGYQLSTPRGLDQGSTPGFVVPADLTFSNGQHKQEGIVVIPRSGGGGDLVVCGTAG